MVASHGLALLCIPVMAFGYWGFSTQLTDKYHLSRLALLITLMGLMAVAVSGIMNGLVLTQFAVKYQNFNNNDTALTTIVTYGHCISRAFAYVFIGNTLLAILIWSVMIIRTGKFPKWLGYYGLFIVVIITACFTLGIPLTTVWGFSLVVFSVVSWNTAAGVLLFISKTSACAYPFSYHHL